MVEVTKGFTFEASHRLYVKSWTKAKNKSVFGKCANFPSHGHSFRLIVTVKGPIKEDGMVINFTKLGSIIEKKIINILDHQYLNEVIGDYQPVTCENILLWMKARLQNSLPGLSKLVLYETEKCFATLNF